MFAIYPGIQKKMHGSTATTLTISNEEMNEVMNIFQALDDSNILLRVKEKKQKRGF